MMQVQTILTDQGAMRAPTRAADAASHDARETIGLPTIELLRRKLHAITQEECVSHVFGALAAGRGGWIVTPNLDHLRRLTRDAEFARLCDQASLSVADGAPLIWASRLAGTPLPERVAGSDLIWHLSKAAASEGRTIYLLGGDEGTAGAAATVLKRDYKGLRVAGTWCPPVGFERDEAHMQALSDALTSAQPDIVFVALGSPKQEVLIDRLRSLLPHAWWIGVGISFSFVCGQVHRAPMWMRRVGLEWLHRLAQEPKRLARRYLTQGLPFAAYLFGHVLLARLRRARRS